MAKKQRGGRSRGRGSGQGRSSGGPRPGNRRGVNRRPPYRGGSSGSGNTPPPDDSQESGEPLPLEPGSGVLELHPNGYGFLRNTTTNFQRERSDPFVPGTMVEKFGLREGVLINGMVQQNRKQQGPQQNIIDVSRQAGELPSETRRKRA